MSSGIGVEYDQPTDEELDPDYVDPTQRLLSLVKTGDWLDAQVFPPLRWAVPGLIPEGYGLFTGAPKTGKSWAALDIGLAVACGGKALGTIDVGPPRPVLYLALEDGDKRLQGRARRLLGDGVALPPMLHFVTGGVDRSTVLPLIRAWLEQHGDRSPLVMLDTLGKVMPPALAGEGAYERDYRIGGHLKTLTDDFPGSTLLVVHHVRKMSSGDWMDSTSGTNGLNGAADWTLNLSRKRGDDGGVLRVTGRDVPEGEYAASCSSGCWQLDGADLHEAAQAAAEREVTESLGDRSTEILDFVAGHPDGVSPAEVALGLDLDKRTAATYLGRLHDAGRLRKPKRGTYKSVVTVVSVDFGPPDTTHTTHTTPTESEPTCSVCFEPMPYAAPGQTTHPTCGGAS